LTEVLDKYSQGEGDFLLPRPPDGDSNLVNIKIYVFGTP